MNKHFEMRMINQLDIDGMSIDEMWQLHEEISDVLSVRLASEKRKLEKRLGQLRQEREIRQLEQNSVPSDLAKTSRREYPRVFPKYRNPQEPSQTWSGRGKQPRWLSSALKLGHTIEEFLIGGASNKVRRRLQRASRARG
jgi:DNA-binding protein H-NS